MQLSLLGEPGQWERPEKSGRRRGWAKMRLTFGKGQKACTRTEWRKPPDRGLLSRGCALPLDTHQHKVNSGEGGLLMNLKAKHDLVKLLLMKLEPHWFSASSALSPLEFAEHQREGRGAALPQRLRNSLCRCRACGGGRVTCPGRFQGCCNFSLGGRFRLPANW